MNNTDLINFSSEIIDICDSSDDFDRGDLQGVIQAIVLKIYKAGQKGGELNG